MSLVKGVLPFDRVQITVKEDLKMEIFSQLFHKLTSFADPLDFVVNIGSIIGWFIGLFWLLRTGMRYRQRKRLLKFTTSSEGRVAISIGVGTSPEGAVREFLKKNFPDVPLVMSYSKQGNFSGEELLKIFEKIKSDFFDLMGRGDISEILLFYGGPVTMMAPIGAIVDNWVPVKLFGRDNEGKYVFHFTLNRELIKAIPPKYKEK